MGIAPTFGIAIAINLKAIYFLKESSKEGIHNVHSDRGRQGIFEAGAA